MVRPIAVRKAAPLAIPAVVGAAGNVTVAGAGAGAATTAAGTTAATGLGSKLLQGAKKIGVTDPKKTAGEIAQQASAQHAQNQQQIKQNNLEAAQNVADKAKEAATVTKAWRLASRFSAPEYQNFVKKLIESAKKVTGKPTKHWDERMGRDRNKPHEARYIDNQLFEHEGEKHDITPFQLSHAAIDYLKEKGLLDNHEENDKVSLTNFLYTDEPHPRPNQMSSNEAKRLSAVMQPGNLSHTGITLHADPVDKEGKTHYFDLLNHADVEEVSNPMNKPSVAVRSKGIVGKRGIVGEHLPNKIVFAPEHELVNSFSSKYEDELAAKFRDEDELQQVLNHRAKKEYERRQKQEEAARQAEQTRQARQAQEEQFQQQPVKVEQQGGMYFVTDPAYDYNKRMMDYNELIQGGYDKYLKSNPFDLAWRMLYKAGVEVHHREPLPEEFTQDINLLDRNHQMNPTENGTMIDNISPHMLRTIELMAKNYKDNENIEPKPFVMPTLRY